MWVFPEVMDVSVAECSRYALSPPVATQVMGIVSMEQVQQNLALVRNFEAMGKKEREALLDRIREQCTDGRHKLFKSTQAHDGPHHRRQHGFSAEQLYGFGNIAMHNLSGVAGFLQALGDLFSDHY